MYGQEAFLAIPMYRNVWKGKPANQLSKYLISSIWSTVCKFLGSIKARLIKGQTVLTLSPSPLTHLSHYWIANNSFIPVKFAEADYNRRLAFEKHILPSLSLCNLLFAWSTNKAFCRTNSTALTLNRRPSNGKRDINELSFDIFNIPFKRQAAFSVFPWNLCKLYETSTFLELLTQR